MRRHEAPVAPDINLATGEPLLRTRASAAVENAKVVVEKALDEIEPNNRARMEHPSRNRYVAFTGQSARPSHASSSPPLHRVTDEEKHAAAILAEAEARESAGLTVTGNSSSIATGNSSSKATVEPRQSGGYWMEGLKRQGAWPWGSNAGDLGIAPSRVLARCSPCSHF
jgi:hypothetical protein